VTACDALINDADIRNILADCEDRCKVEECDGARLHLLNMQLNSLICRDMVAYLSEN